MSNVLNRVERLGKGLMLLGGCLIAIVGLIALVYGNGIRAEIAWRLLGAGAAGVGSGAVFAGVVECDRFVQRMRARRRGKSVDEALAPWANRSETHEPRARGQVFRMPPRRGRDHPPAA